MDQHQHTTRPGAPYTRSLSPFGRKLALLQAAYFLVTGIWPLLSIGTFQKITGPKQDLWLVKTVGVLVAVIGAVVGLAGLRGRLTSAERLLAAGSAAGLTAIDVVYVARRRIRPIYLLDALLELGIIAGWLADHRLARANEPLAPGEDERAPAATHPMGQGYYISSYEPGTD